MVSNVFSCIKELNETRDEFEEIEDCGEEDDDCGCSKSESKDDTLLVDNLEGNFCEESGEPIPIIINGLVEIVSIIWDVLLWMQSTSYPYEHLV